MDKELSTIFKNIARKVSLDFVHPIGETVMFATADFDPNVMWGGYGNSRSLIGCR